MTKVVLDHFFLPNILYIGEIQLQVEANLNDKKLQTIDSSTNKREIYKKADELPPSWDWRSLGLMTTDLNQHIPTYWYIL